jgi:hypothetical protein
MKRILEFGLKILLVTTSVYFIIHQIDVQKVVEIPIKINTFLWFCGIGSLFIINWFFEIYKWKLIVSNFQIISWKSSTKQTLLAFLTSTFIPAKMGEFGIKLIYFEKYQQKNVLTAHFLIHFFQMLVTLFFGIFGLLFLNLNEAKINNLLLIFLIFLAIMIILMLFFKNTSFFGISFQNIFSKIKTFSSKINQKVVGLSVLRYFVFLHQFYFFLIFFHVYMSYFQAISIISSVYILASILPSFSFLDLAIKGSIAIYLFSFFAIASEKIFWATASLWVFNTGFPLIIALVIFMYNKLNFK